VGACPRPSWDEDAFRRRRADGDDGQRTPPTATTAGRRRLHSRSGYPSVDGDRPQQTVDRTGSTLIADGGVRGAEGAARDRPAAQAEPGFARMAVGPSTLPPSDSEDGGGGGRGHVRPRINARRTQGRLRSMGARSRPDDGQGRDLRPAPQAQSVELAENGAAGDLAPQVAGDLGGAPPLAPEVGQASNPVFGPDGGGHDETRGQRARSARPRPPFLRPPFLRPPWPTRQWPGAEAPGQDVSLKGPDLDQNGMSSFRS